MQSGSIGLEIPSASESGIFLISPISRDSSKPHPINWQDVAPEEWVYLTDLFAPIASVLHRVEMHRRWVTNELHTRVEKAPRVTQHEAIDCGAHTAKFQRFEPHVFEPRPDDPWQLDPPCPMPIRGARRMRIAPPDIELRDVQRGEWARRARFTLPVRTADPKKRKAVPIAWSSLSAKVGRAFEDVSNCLRPNVIANEEAAKQLWQLNALYRCSASDEVLVAACRAFVAFAATVPPLPIEPIDPPEPIPALALRIITDFASKHTRTEYQHDVIKRATEAYRCPSAKCQFSTEIEVAAKRAYWRADKEQRRQVNFERRTVIDSEIDAAAIHGLANDLENDTTRHKSFRQ